MTRLGYGAAWDNANTHFRGRAGVLLEFAPNKFAQYVMRTHECEISIDQEVETIWDGPLSPIRIPTSRQIRMVLEGTLTSLDEMRERPAWATAQPEIEARRELEQRR
jgi:hypothetical protein